MRRTLLTFLFAAALPAFAQPPPAQPASAPPQSANVEVRERTLRQMGLSEPQKLRGVEGGLYLPFGQRLDEVVSRATLTLKYSYSPALLPELSHLWVQLNGETVGTLPLPKESAGKDVSAVLELDPRKFTDYNQLKVQLVGHYTLECEDPLNSALWAVVNPDSALRLELKPLALAEDLSLLPAPFFDRRDERRLELPFVFAGLPDDATLEAAGTVASWFGALADYRSARFPVLMDRLPTRHAVVLAVNAHLPEGLSLKPVEQPTISELPLPDHPAVKLLVLQGKDAAQLKIAAEALVRGRPVLTGAVVTVKDLPASPRRDAYDAPKWLRSDRAVKLGELVDGPDALQAFGHVPPPIRVNLRVPPDLFTWTHRTVPMDLHYRYSAPPEKDNSALTVSINDEFVHAFPLLPAQSAGGGAGQVLLPLLEQTGAGLRDEVSIPAFQIGADNQLQFRFVMDYHKSSQCQGSAADTARAAIDPDSTLDLSKFPHYAAMPNLALYANAGYPFTRYADLAETTVVLPDQAAPAQIEAALFLLGRMGRQTGAAGVKLHIARAGELGKDVDSDLLVIGAGTSGHDLLADWREHLPVALADGGRLFRPRAAAAWYLPRFGANAPEEGAALSVDAHGPMSALLGLESPLHSGRSAVVLTASAPDALAGMLDALEDGGLLRQVRGDAVLLQGRALTALRGPTTYHVGHLPLLTALWLFLSQYPLALVLFALAAALTGAFLANRALKRQAAQRLGDQGPQA